MTPQPQGLAHSVQARLLNHARSIQADTNLVLARYATERFLYRLSQSQYAERFVLKGALLMLAWFGETIRPTRDVDLSGYGDLSDVALLAIIREICEQDVEADGMEFDPAWIALEAIRMEDPYGGKRATIRAKLGQARIRVQVDVGVGDAVVPAAEMLIYPSMLDMPRPKIRAYAPETAIAEKLHAMVVLDARNSRMRDFFDVDTLATRMDFDGQRLTDAIGATFQRRSTPPPVGLPLALTPAFAATEGKQGEWAAFTARNRIAGAPPELAIVVERLAKFLGPPLEAVARGGAFRHAWRPPGPWGEIEERD